LVIKNGNVVNVFTKEIYPADIAISNGVIAGVGRYEGAAEVDASGKYVCPGLIDAHVHIESSLASPREFARAILPHGTTCVIADPHEIANVRGVTGIRYMLEQAKLSPVHMFFMAPSCVPCLSDRELKSITRSDKSIIGLGEVMDYQAVLRGQTANPPKRSVTFLANAGHFEAMAGEKAFIARRMRGARSEKYVKLLFGSVRSGRRGLDDAAASVWEDEVVTADTQPKTPDEIAEERIRALGRVSRAIGQAEKKIRSAEHVSVVALRYDPNEGKPYERQLEQSEITRRQKMIQDLQAALPKMKTSLATLKQLVAEAKPLRRTGDTATREAALAEKSIALLVS
jgi:hypothetical protein